MIERKAFVSSKNYYFVMLLHYGIMPFFLVSSLFLSKKKIPNARKILFIELGHLGDMLMTTRAIFLVKEQFPESTIVCICTKSGALALQNLPFINEVKIIDEPLWYRTEGQKGIIRILNNVLHLIKTVRSVKAKSVISFRNVSYHLDYLAIWFSGIPERIGFGNKGLNYILSYAGNCNISMPIPLQKIQLVKNWLSIATNIKISANPIFIPKIESELESKLILKIIGVFENDNIIAINPGAQHTFLWPAMNYVELCKKINNSYPSFKIIFLGTTQHIDFIKSIQEKLTFITYNLAGTTTLDQLFFILKKVVLLVTVDTGIRHIANAIPISQIALRHSADTVASFGKYVDSETILFASVPCSPCGKQVCPLGTLACMVNISVDNVFNNISNMNNIPKK